jgi:hypothetical protein
VNGTDPDLNEHGVPSANPGSTDAHVHERGEHQGPAVSFETVRQRYPEPVARNAQWTMWGHDGGTPETSAYAIENGSLGLRGVYVPSAAGHGVGEWHWHLPGESEPVMVTPLKLPSSAPSASAAHTLPRIAAEARQKQVGAALAAAPWGGGLRWRADGDELYAFGPAGPEGPAAVFKDGLRPVGDQVVHVAAHVGERGARDSAWLTATRDLGWLRSQYATGDPAATASLDRYGWRYDIEPPGGVDVNQTLDLASPHPERREVLYPGGVDGRYIRGAQRLDKGRAVVPYLANPDFGKAGGGHGTAREGSEG